MRECQFQKFPWMMSKVQIIVPSHQIVIETEIVYEWKGLFKTGKSAGCKTVLVLTGYGLLEREKIYDIKPDYIYKNLLGWG